MKLKNLVIAGAVALLPLVAGAATIIVPVAGSGPGTNNSLWQSELTLHNTSSTSVDVALTYNDRRGFVKSDSVTVAGRNTVSIADIVKTRFGQASSTGAIVITVPDAAAQKIAVASRITNVAPGGEFGEDVDAIRIEDAATPGDLTILPAPSNATGYRFNFGVYAVEAATVRWELVRADGTVVGSRSFDYEANTQTQWNNGISQMFNVEPKDNDVIHALVTAGKAMFYGSAVNNATGDPYYVRGTRAHEEIRVNFVGLDLNEDGKVDVFDADHDGVLDQPVDMFTSLFGNYFRVVVTNDKGLPVTYELVDAPRDAQLLDEFGTVVWAPGGDVKGLTGSLKIRVISGSETAILTIPVKFK